MSAVSFPEAQSCKHCSAALPPDALVCKHCHTLVHSAQLEELAAAAKMFEEHKELGKAKDHWLKGIPLLPPESKQAAWIHEHTRRLELAMQVMTPAKQQKKSLGRFAPLIAVLIALGKGKALLALFNLKFILSLGAFIGVYWSLYGMWFGIGFAAQVALHEFGHYIDIKRRGLPADMPVFLPGMGAFVRWQAMGVPLETRAAVSLAGPLAGLLAAALCSLVGPAMGSAGLWAALTRVGAWLNLLNLIPVWGLDGGHAFLALAKKERLIILTFALLAFTFTGESVLLLIALGATWRLFTKDLPHQGSSRTTAYFLAVLLGLVFVMWVTPMEGLGTP